MRPRGTFTLLVTVLVAVAALIGSASAHADVPAPGDFSPAIWSDKADYSPGEHVVLSGANWQPGEPVHITVNDDAGSTWNRSVDVAADDKGAITDQFDLPGWFVAQYSVRAESASGSVATYSFTDGNVKFVVTPTGTTTTITETKYATNNCSGAATSGPTTVNATPGDTVGGANAGDSVKLVAAAVSDQGGAFKNWTGDITTTTSTTVCVPGSSGTVNVSANYNAPVTNSPPATVSNTASVTVNEGSQATNTGTWSDANAGDTVNLTASVGTVIKSGTNASGTWSWSYTPADGPTSPSPQVVTITAGDGTTQTSTTFDLTVNNVAPTVTLSPGNDLTVSEGATAHTYSYTISDPGVDTIAGVTTSCGANGTKVAGSDTNSNTAGSFQCRFPDGLASSTVSASATDSDNATGNLATQSVSVNNVAPAVGLSGAGNVDEGSTHTYTFTVTDPGQDTFTVDSGFPDCDAGATDNGTLVSGSLTVNAGGGSFDCTFPDGPSTANVKVKVSDSDGASDSTSQAVDVATVANVAPAITAPAGQSANEGASTSLDLGSFADPGASDGPWNVDVDWGDGSTHTTFTKSAAGSLGSQSHTYDDGPATRTVSVTVTDKNDGADTKTFKVTVSNVAPTATLDTDNAQSVDEGSTHTYSYTISDPGVDTVSSVDTSCGANGTKGAETHTNTSGSFECTFADGDKTSVVSASATDSDLATGGLATQSVTVGNVAPTVTPAADQTADEGASTSLDLGSFGDPGANDGPWAVDVDWGDGTTATTFDAAARGTLASSSHTYADGPADHTVKVTVTDKDGDSDSETFSVHVDNVAPTVHVSGDANVDEGDYKTYTFTVSDPGQDTFSPASTAYPDCDSAGSNGELVANTYIPTPSGGSFQCFFPDGPATANVKMKVVDEDGLSGTGSESVQIVQVANVAPTVTAAAGQTAHEGASTAFDLGSFGDPGADSPWSVDVDWGDGSTHGSATSTAPGALGTLDHSYADNGTYTATVTVNDKNGASDSKTFTVDVSNVAPTVAAPADDAGVEGVSKSFGLGSFTDPGADDGPWKVKVNWGDGSADEDLADRNSTGSLGPAPHAYADNGTYTVTVTVTDKDGGHDSKTYKVTIANADPTATIGNDGPIDEGETATISLTSPGDVAADAAAGFHYEFHCDGSTFSSAASYAAAGVDSSTTCSYADNGTKTVRARIIDKDDGASVYTTDVHVNNVAPTVTAPADQSGSEGSSSSYDLGSFTDANPNDGDWTVDVDWGDGSGPDGFQKTATGAIGTKSHTYADNGAYTVTVGVKDKDGGRSTKTFTVTISNVAPKITSFSGSDYLVGPNAFIVGGIPLSRLTTQFTDPGSDMWTALFTYSDGTSQTLGPQFLSGNQTTHSFGSSSVGSIGCKTASVKVSDDDGGFDTASTTIHVGSGTFQAPMTNQPLTDKLKNGQTLPVKVHINDCNGVGQTGLTPVIRLIAGDTTPQNDDSTSTITPGSVSAADTNGLMRGQGNGDYIYNMAVNLPQINKDYTVVIYPFGTGSQVQLGHVIQATR